MTTAWVSLRSPSTVCVNTGNLFIDAGDTQQEENGGTEQVTDRDSIVRGSRFTIAWETSSDNAVYVTMTLLLI